MKGSRVGVPGRVMKIFMVGCALSLFLMSATVLSFTDRIIAVVNKDVITWSDLEHEVEDEYKRLKAKYQGEDLARRYHEKQREVLNKLIDDRLQIQEAKAKGVSVTQEEIDAALRRTPLPPTQTEKEFGHQMLLKKLFDFEVRRNVVVEEEELRRYYDAHKNQFLKSPQYRLKQILVPGKEEFERERARKKAETIHAAWNPETSLEDLAAQHVGHFNELGWVQEHEMVDPLGQAIKELKPGQLSAPIETPLGFHLLMIVEIQPPEPLPFESVQGQIHTTLMKQHSEEAYRHWLADLKTKAFIEVKF